MGGGVGFGGCGVEMICDGVDFVLYWFGVERVCGVCCVEIVGGRKV